MSDKIEALLDEAFLKHHSTEILNRPFDPEKVMSSGARAAVRSPVMGIIAAAAVLALAFAGIRQLNNTDRIETKSVSPQSEKMINTDEADRQFDSLMQAMTICGEKVTLPITIGRLKEIADIYNVQPCGTTNSMVVFKEKNSNEICFIAYIGGSSPFDECIVKEIYVGSSYAEGAVMLDKLYVGMQTDDITIKYKILYDSFYMYSISGMDSIHCTLSNKLGYYVDIEIKEKKISSMRIVLREGGAKTDNIETK